MRTNVSTLRGYPTDSSRNAVGPDQLVAMTGSPIDMASTRGRPQPSPLYTLSISQECLHHVGPLEPYMTGGVG